MSSLLSAPSLLAISFPSDADGLFFPGRQAQVVVKGVVVGVVGVVHPDALGRFDPAIGHPCSALELDLELFAMQRL